MRILEQGLRNTALDNGSLYSYFDNGFIVATTSLNAYEIARLLVDSGDSAVLTGANEFNGIKWFNEEMMSRALEIAEQFYIADAKKSDAKKVESVFKSLKKAQQSAEYRCENFIATFKPKVRKTLKKSTQTKKPATKTAGPAQKTQVKSGSKTARKVKTTSDKSSSKK